MKKGLQKLLLLAVLFVGTTSFASAAAFNKGENFIGPHLGYSWYGGVFGLWYEKAVHEYVGIGAQFDIAYGYGYAGGVSNIYNRTNVYFGHVISFRLLFTVAGHIPLRQVPNLDLFIKLGLGYRPAISVGRYVNSNGDVVTGAKLSHWFDGELTLGIRYFFNDKMAFRAEIGFPTYLKAAVDFKF